MKYLKVTVTGYINTTFIGNDDEVHAFLKILKKQKDALISAEQLKKYKKEKKYWNSDVEWFSEYTKKFELTVNIEQHTKHDFF